MSDEKPQAKNTAPGLAKSSTIYASPVESARSLAAAVPSAFKTLLASAQCTGDDAVGDPPSQSSPVLGAKCGADDVRGIVETASSECCDVDDSFTDGNPAMGDGGERNGRGSAKHQPRRPTQILGRDVAVAVSPGKFAGAASLNVTRGKKASPRNVLDLDAALCGDSHMYEDGGDLEGRQWMPPPSPSRWEGTKLAAAGGSIKGPRDDNGSMPSVPSSERTADEELIRRFEIAFEEFLEQRRRLQTSSSSDRLASSSDIDEIHGRLLTATADRARIEVELKSQLEEVERSKTEMEVRLRKELDEARKAKERTQAELRGKITRAFVEQAAAAQKAAAIQRDWAKSEGEKKKQVSRSRHPMPERPAPRPLTSVRCPPRRNSHQRRGHGLTPAEGVAAKAQARSAASGPIGWPSDRNEEGRNPPEISKVPTSIEWDDETISTVWAADSAIEDAMAELRVGLPSPPRGRPSSS
uniref:Uncharacterized protein n=1 Tax=Odontella aurita TaxID=265563 RepID=A0A7S4JPB3_9STRA|mmetsp:Transcript_5109/g.14705  ORF Transcript_5109/g.14705 Transcript_5109/m.14705 type:complete len:469 (+) Transcript_5109:283-1689(+)